MCIKLPRRLGIRRFRETMEVCISGLGYKVFQRTLEERLRSDSGTVPLERGSFCRMRWLRLVYSPYHRAMAGPTITGCEGLFSHTVYKSRVLMTSWYLVSTAFRLIVIWDYGSRHKSKSIGFSHIPPLKQQQQHHGHILQSEDGLW